MRTEQLLLVPDRAADPSPSADPSADPLLAAAAAPVPLPGDLGPVPPPPSSPWTRLAADDLRFDHLDTPIGRFRLLAADDALVALHLVDGDSAVPDGPWRPAAGRLDAVRRQLDDYVAGRRHGFSVPLRLEGTPFQRTVWRALTEIPYGTTASYGELARRIGRPGAARAVGAANRRNPVAVIVPCHRVIGAGGGLTGYGLGLARKAWLLDHERRHAGPAPTADR